MNEIYNEQLSGSKNVQSIGVHASENENSALEDEHPLRASDMNELRNTANPFQQNELDLDETIGKHSHLLVFFLIMARFRRIA